MLRLPWRCSGIVIFGLGLATAGTLTAQAAGPQKGQAAQEPQSFGEVIDIRTGFVRVTLPAGAPPPRVEDVEVLWRRQPQRVVRIVPPAPPSVAPDAPETPPETPLDRTTETMVAEVLVTLDMVCTP